MHKQTKYCDPGVLQLQSFKEQAPIWLPQKYTQSNGRRPFGLSTLIIGFDLDSNDGTPHLYQTDPSGTYHEWKVRIAFIDLNIYFAWKE